MGCLPRARLHHPADPGGVVLPHPVLREAAAVQGRRDRHRRARHLLRAGAGHQRPVARRTSTTPSTRPRRSTRRRAAPKGRGDEHGLGRGRVGVGRCARGRGGARRVRGRARPSRRGPGGPAAASTFTVGMLLDGPAVMMLLRRHADLAAGARLQHRLRRRRPALHPLLRLPLPVQRLDARPDHEREHAPAAHVLGAGGPLLVRAHRPLVGGEAELRRRPQGLHHQPRRRRRPDLRRDHPVLRRRPDLRHPHHQRDGGERRDRATSCCSWRRAR